MDERVKELIFESFRAKYHQGSKKAKGAMLKEVCERLNCHRKHATWMLRKRSPGRKRVSGKRGPKSRYSDPEFLRALHRVRRVMEFHNAEVIKLNMPEWLPFIEEHYGAFSSVVREKLLKISPATMKRIFQHLREQGGEGLSTTRPGSILRHEIPIRAESFWDESVPGKMAADTVAHCGNSTEGQYVNSLDMVCRVTHWTAQRATWGKGHSGVLDQLREDDTIVVWKLNRLARSTRHLLETIETIREAGARFQSLSEPWADTTTHAGKMIMTVFTGIAEFERELICERTTAGRIAAKRRGVRFGRPRSLNAEQEKLIQRLLDAPPKS